MGVPTPAVRALDWGQECVVESVRDHECFARRKLPIVDDTAIAATLPPAGDLRRSRDASLLARSKRTNQPRSIYSARR